VSLKDRLGRLTGDSGPSPSKPDKEAIGELRRKIERIMSRSGRHAIAQPAEGKTRRAVPLEELVAGEETRTAHGCFYDSRATLPARDVHGNTRICDASCTNMEAAAILAGQPAAGGLSLSDGLFLDTETTGLAGGTGTFPFLVGLGWFEAGCFVTCQLFARDFSEENAMLQHLAEIAAEKRFLVTFNGKAFDMNLLTTRFILNRCRETLTGLPHIDLLHPSRRILAHRLENARLSTIEAHVLGVEREGDVPGFEIPQRYFDWLRQRDGRLLADVFTHNRLDVVSMATLLRYLSSLVGGDGCRTQGGGHHGDLLRAAWLLHERGDGARAGGMLEALASSHMPDVAAGARRSLSLVHKKARRWEEAAALWRDLLDADPADFFAVVELAKYHEHCARDHAAALRLVEGLLDAAPRLCDADREALTRRLDRLRRKVSPEG
jgi:uncharacterized protein YprB with RNaseH-like and TPR domain